MRRKKMTRIIKLTLIGLIFCLSFAMVQATVSFDIVAPSSVSPGDTITVKVRMNPGGDAVAGAGFTIQAQGLSFVGSASKGSLGTQIGSIFNCDPSGNKWICSMGGTDATTSNGVLATAQATITGSSGISLSMIDNSASDDLGDELGTSLATKFNIALSQTDPECTVATDCGQSSSVLSCQSGTQAVTTTTTYQCVAGKCTSQVQPVLDPCTVGTSCVEGQGCVASQVDAQCIGKENSQWCDGALLAQCVSGKYNSKTCPYGCDAATKVCKSSPIVTPQEEAVNSCLDLIKTELLSNKNKLEKVSKIAQILVGCIN